MKTIQLEVNNNLFNEFMKWLYKHPEEDFNITSVKDLSPQFDEDGIEYIKKEEQKEIDQILKNPDCHEIVHSKVISFDETK